jgi:hypothetical protein
MDDTDRSEWSTMMVARSALMMRVAWSPRLELRKAPGRKISAGKKTYNSSKNE